MRFNRENPAGQSLVERAILRGLGVESHDFEPMAPREKIVPERVVEERKRAAEKAARPAKSA